MRSLLIVIGICLSGASGCKKTEPVERADPGLVLVKADQVIKTDIVGTGEHETRATYVLVDAQNLSDGDLDVTLTGTLRDAAGAEIGPVRAESLRIPSGGIRTFVLVDQRFAERPEAVAADIEVRSALIPRWPSDVTITDAHVFDDAGAAQVAASVTNTADRRGRVIVFGAFHDPDGKPMQRQFALVDLAPGASKTVRLTGPTGSRSAYIFLGQATY